MEVKPYNQQESKKKQVEEMFDNIAPQYDFLNHFLSAGIDIQWRKKMMKAMASEKVEKGLDIATGTGDVALLYAQKNPASHLVGVDLSENMLNIGRQKAEKKNLSDRVEFQQGDAENLPFGDNFFDVATVSFGVRNFENLEKGLAEIYRVLKPGKALFVLEFSKPTVFPLGQLYDFYFKNILPTIGKIQSKDPKAYSYLYESVQNFPYGESFVKILKDTGFKTELCKSLSLGICHLYSARK